MTHNPTLKIITANDLLTGYVVYLSASGAWVDRHADAITFENKTDANARLARVQRGEASVVSPYLARAMLAEDKTLMPVHFREVFRTRGPSNRFLGKQALAI